MIHPSRSRRLLKVDVASRLRMTDASIKHLLRSEDCQGHKGVTPHIRAAPHTTKSTNTRPRDQFYRHRRDPSSWNLADMPKDGALLVTLACAIDKCFECDKNEKFCVCPTAVMMENAYMEAAGIDISRDLLWDYHSANARAVLGFMENYWSLMCPKRTHEFYKVPHSECAERVFAHS